MMFLMCLIACPVVFVILCVAANQENSYMKLPKNAHKFRL